MIEERLKITNLEDRLKTEMTGGVMGDINTTTEALRLALQQEERLKLDMGSLKNMESLLGSAGMARMLQMMEVDAKNFGAGLTTGGGLESGPGFDVLCSGRAFMIALLCRRWFHAENM